ncbi:MULTISPECIES: UPF0149 family protein [unclassified Luteimonas]
MAQMEDGCVPIEEEDLAALETLAESWAMDHGGMPLEALDGLFSALMVGPAPAAGPGDYLPLAMGDARLGAEALQQAHALLAQLWSHVKWRVAQPLADEDDESEEAMQRDFELLPFLGLPAPEHGELGPDDDPLASVPQDFPLGALWASGFLQGVALRAEGWSAWAADDEDLARDLEDLARLTLIDPVQAGELGLDWEDRFDFDERWDLLSSVPALLQDLHLAQLQEAQVPVQGKAQPGRNDPCPCGSGQKWKKCCGASVH